MLFQYIHYSSFIKPKPDLDDRVTIKERMQVRDVFLELDEMIWPTINSHGWDLHRHRQKVHYVSSDHFIYLPDGRPIVNYIDGMWLHYGKHPDQLDFIKTIGGFDYRGYDVNEYFNAFYLHTRIQFYINSKVFRCWLLLATDKNYYDRSEYLRKIRMDSSNKEKLYKLIVPLFDKEFFYEIDSELLPLKTGLSQNDLIKFVKKDRGGVYSGIVKEYQPNDPKISRSNIQSEMINNLKLLYPIYDFMAWRPKK